MMQRKRNGGILVLAELKDGQLHPVTYQLLYKGRELAEQMKRLGGASKETPTKTQDGTLEEARMKRVGSASEEERMKTSGKAPAEALLSCLILGPDGVNAEEAALRGADQVYYMKDPSFAIPDEMHVQKNVKAVLEIQQPEVVLIGATHFGRSLAPRLAASLNTGLTADCIELKLDENGRLIQIRPAFSDHILAHIKTVTNPQMATIRYQEFPEAVPIPGKAAAVTELPLYERRDDSCFITELPPKEVFDITDATVVVAGGRGIRRKEDLALLEELAKVLGGVVGASRGLVDTGLISSAHQVGYSGNRVKPDLYIACGISGAPQHLAGMKEAKTIIAVNSDPSAPIFQVADLGYVGDLYQIIPRLTGELIQMGFGKQLEQNGGEQEAVR